MRLAIPPEVKQILQSPHDETDWAVLERLRIVLLDVMQGKTDVHVEGEAEASAMADAVQAGPNNRHGIEIGEGSKIPAGGATQYLCHGDEPEQHQCSPLRQ